MLSEFDRTMPSEERVPLHEAAWDVVEAGHRVLLDRIELLTLEVRQVAAAVQRDVVLSLFALVMLATAWLALNGTAVLLLKDHLPLAAVGAVTAVVNAVFGTALLLGIGGRS